MYFPKITIITPSFNQDKYLEQTILSVISQGYTNLEYIVMDGGSTDQSVEIIKKYEKHLFYWESAPDKGMYDAIQRGFKKGSGEIMTYINSDDIMHTGSLFSIAQIFSDYENIDWLGCIPNSIDEYGKSVAILEKFPQWNKYRLLRKDYYVIQQEGTFFRRRLWEKAGNYISTTYRLASDLDLWSRFFLHADYYILPAILASFRVRRNNQKSLEGLKSYLNEVEDILNKMPMTDIEKKTLHRYKFIQKYNLYRIPIIKKTPFVRNVQNTVLSFPKKLTFNRYLQKFEITN